jgi:hypothetical protein
VDLTLEATVRHIREADPQTVAAPRWLVVMVRAWVDGDRQMIRLIVRSESDDICRVAVESSNRAAADRLLVWLDEFARSNARDAPDDEKTDEAEMTD